VSGGMGGPAASLGAWHGPFFPWCVFDLGQRVWLGGHQPEVRADRGPGEPVPVTDLDCQPEPGQGGDPPQTAESAHQVGIAGVLSHGSDLQCAPRAVTTAGMVPSRMSRSSLSDQMST
jgi:hypothetical protein